MRGHAVLGVFFVCACAEVPASVCFSDEPCAVDASVRGGGRGGGSGVVGGGAGGGMTNTGGGGGTVTPDDAGTLDAGWTRPVRLGSTAFETSWASVSAALQTTTTTPLFLRTSISITAAVSGCQELFRGAVAMPNGHVLGIPFCADHFLDFDPVTESAQWIGTRLFEGTTTGGLHGHYGGGVLGCDGRVYALPFARNAIMRFDPTDGGFTELPLGSVRHFSGGVIASSCDEFLVVAAGDDGLWALDVYEQGAVLSPLSQNLPSAQGRRFEGVARLGDDFVLSAPVLPVVGGQDFALLLDLKTGVASTRLMPFLPGTVHGVASTLSETVFFASETGSSGEFVLDGGWRAGPTTTGTCAWSASSMDGWVYASTGGSLVGFEEGGQVVVTLSNGSAPQRSGGLVVLPTGDVVDLPGLVTGPASIIHYVRSGSFVGAGNEALGPWFNKL